VKCLGKKKRGGSTIKVKKTKERCQGGKKRFGDRNLPPETKTRKKGSSNSFVETPKKPPTGDEVTRVQARYEWGMHRERGSTR